MADQTEIIDIQVRESGTDGVTASLEKLGLTGEQATARVATGYARLSTSASGATSNQILLNRAAQGGVTNMADLASALDLMTNAELRAAERAGAYATAQDGANAAAARGSGVLRTHAGDVETLASKYSALGGVLVGVAGYLGLHEFVEVSDEFTTIKNRLSAVNDTADAGYSVFQKLGTQIISLTGSAGVAAESFKNLNASIALPTAADKVRQAQEALDAFNGGLDTTVGKASAANDASAKLNAQLAALHGTTGDAADATTNYWQSIDRSTLASAGNLPVERTRAELINSVRQAMVAQTLETERQEASQRTLASANEDTRKTYEALKNAAIANGTSLEGSTELYQRLSSGAKEAGISNDDLLKTVVGVSEQLRTFGVQGRKATASMNELAEGFSEGEIKGKQLQAIIREFPQLLQPVADKLTGGSLNLLEKQFASTGISASDFAAAYVGSSDKIAAASAKVTITVSGALESLKTRFIDYIGTSQQAGTAGDAIVASINLLGEAIPIVIPLVAALAVGFGALKIAGVAAEVAGALGVFTPFGAVLAVIAGAIAACVNAYANYEVSSGAAKDKTQAFVQILQQFKPILDEIGNAFGPIISQVYSFIASFGTGSSEADKFKSAIEKIVEEIKAMIDVAAGITKFVVTAFELAINAASGLGTIIGNIINKLAGLNASGGGQRDGSTSSLTEGARSPTQGTGYRDGGMIYARDGVSVGTGFRVPGADRPDTVPLNMMVSKGERVIVQTEDQQAKHDKIMSTFRNGGIVIPHFAAGGFVQAGSDGTLGYTGADLTKSTYAPPPVAASNAATQTQQAKSSADSAPPHWATRHPYGTEPYREDMLAFKAGLSPYPGEENNVPPLYAKQGSPNAVTFDGSAYTSPIQYRRATNGSSPIPHFSFYQGAPIDGSDTAKAYYKRNNFGVPATEPKFTYGGSQVDTKSEADAVGSLIRNGIGQEGALADATSSSTFDQFRNGGIIYARDGADFVVPGAGPVDSRMVNMAVSPGERVRVDTSDQQAKASTIAQPRPTPSVAVTIMANDPGAFGRSKRQITDTLAKSLSRVPN